MKKQGLIFLEIVFILIGILLIVAGIYLEINNSKFFESKHLIKGEISKIVYYEHDSNGKVPCDVYVKYEVNEEVYEQKLPDLYDKMMVGRKINIYYSKENPSDIEIEATRYSSYILIGIGVINIFIGIVMFFYYNIRKTGKEREIKD